MKKFLNNLKPTSNFQLLKDKYKYARVYVVYESDDDPFDYRWIVRTMELKECPEVVEIWKEIEEAQLRKKEEKRIRNMDDIQETFVTIEE